MIRHVRPAIVAMALGLVVAGCAGTRTRTVELSYTPAARSGASPSGTPGSASGALTAGATPQKAPAVRRLAVATFVDGRERQDRIGLLESPNGETTYLSAGPLADAITSAVVARLEADGYEVVRLGQPWDVRTGPAPAADADVVVGGVVEAFEGVSDAAYIWAPSDADVRLRVASRAPDGSIRLATIKAEMDGTVRSATLEDELQSRFRAAVDLVPVATGLRPSESGPAK